MKSLSHVRLFVTPWTVAHRPPWDSPGKNTVLSCHFLLQGNLPNPRIEPWSPTLQANALTSEPPGKLLNISTLSEVKWSEFTQWCPALCDPMDCSLPGSPLHGILQARVLEWVAISFSRGSSWPRDRTRVSSIPGRCFNLWATREAVTFSESSSYLIRWHVRKKNKYCVISHIQNLEKIVQINLFAKQK